MTEEDINKTIAEYVGWFRTENQSGKFWQHRGTSITRQSLPAYAQDLNELTLVVEKLRIEHEFTPSMFCNPLGYYEYTMGYCGQDGAKLKIYDDEDCEDCWGNSKSPSLALATACAKVIKELG